MFQPYGHLHWKLGYKLAKRSIRGDNAKDVTVKEDPN